MTRRARRRCTRCRRIASSFTARRRRALSLCRAEPLRLHLHRYEAAYQNYRDILARPVDQPDNVAPDYKTQASALLYGDPYDWNKLNQPASVADYLRAYY